MASKNTLSKIRACIDDANAQFLERSLVFDHAWAALLGAHHIWLYGPPGEGKSAAIRFVASQLKGARYYEYLFSKFSQPKSVFGPIKISQLKKDIEEYDIDGYLPTAHVALLDEGGRASAAIRETLLTLINERVMKNGKKVVECPLISLFSGSNSLLEEEEDEAFRDRFLCTLHVSAVKDEDNFLALLDMPQIKATTSITMAQLADAQSSVKDVKMPEDFKRCLTQIRRKLADVGVTASTRRWISIAKGLRAFAWLDGEDTLQPEHTEWAADMLWRTVDERRKILGIVGEVANPAMARAVSLLDRAHTVVERVPGDNDPNFMDQLSTANKCLKDIASEIESIIALNDDRRLNRVKSIFETVNGMKRELVQRSQRRMNL